MDTLNKIKLLEREQKKYDLLHQNIKYGGRTGRAKQFFKNDDAFHKTVRSIMKTSKTMLDVGCGKGFFIDVFSSHFKNLAITGCDISQTAIQGRPDLHLMLCSAHKMPFKDGQFDIVAHMDGMEHIPAEIELDVMNELSRVAKRYMYMTIATHPVKHHDDKYEKQGLGAVHINMKTADEWRHFISKFCIENGFNFIDFQDYKDWVHVLIGVM